ncbi:YwqG family protein [Phytomonospora sp. NPDC050363]|uniref:YwqG family protein n=1 Tax=Phytomonospora sp. NPDC050363 TaxID=3155642 RepID=UPI0033F36B17
MSSSPHQRFAEAVAAHLLDRVRRQRLAAATPGIRLRHSRPGDAVAGWLRGDPVWPPGASWPCFDDGYPLAHLLTLDLAVLPRTGLDLPDTGWLVFFVSDDELDHGEVHWVREGAPVEALGDTGERVEVTAVVEPTWAGFDHPDLVTGWEPRLEDRWQVEITDVSTLPVHRVGGFGEGVQYDVEFAPGSQVLVGSDGEELPVLLAQIDTDYEAGIGWGDVGNSHWVIGREALAARRFEEVEMFWSCH